MEPVYRGIEMATALAVRAIGTRITYQGLEDIPERGGAVVVMNHISYIDYLPAGLATRQRRRRIRFMLKAEMLEVGAVDWIIRHTRCIPVDRSAGAGAYAEAVQYLADDHAARHRMGAAARERALVEFSPERMWEQHQRAYELALQNRWRRTRR